MSWVAAGMTLAWPVRSASSTDALSPEPPEAVWLRGVLLHLGVPRPGILRGLDGVDCRLDPIRFCRSSYHAQGRGAEVPHRQVFSRLLDRGLFAA